MRPAPLRRATSRLALCAVALAALPACRGQGEWVPTVWGGPVLDDARAPESAGRFATEDGCDVAITTFVVSLREGGLLTPDGSASAILPGDQLFDLARPGPHSAASVVLPRGDYPETVYVLGPAVEPGPSVLVGRGALTGWDNAASDANPARGNATAAQRDAMIAATSSALLDASIACGEDSVAASLLVDDVEALLRCPEGDFAVPGGSFGATRLDVAGASLLGGEGEPFVRADADADGLLGLAELDAAPADPFDGADDAEGLDPATLGGHVRLALRRAFATPTGPCAWEALPEAP